MSAFATRAVHAGLPGQVDGQAEILAGKRQRERVGDGRWRVWRKVPLAAAAGVS
jgi:hypothetical protein